MELLGGVCFNRALVSLELSFCGLTAEAGPLLVDGLMKCPTLKTLELKGNDLGADGVLAVLGAVKARPGLSTWAWRTRASAARPTCRRPSSTCSPALPCAASMT